MAALHTYPRNWEEGYSTQYGKTEAVYASKPEEIRRTLVDSSLRASGHNTSQTSATVEANVLNVGRIVSLIRGRRQLPGRNSSSITLLMSRCSHNQLNRMITSSRVL